MSAKCIICKSPAEGRACWHCEEQILMMGARLNGLKPGQYMRFPLWARRRFFLYHGQCYGTGDLVGEAAQVHRRMSMIRDAEVIWDEIRRPWPRREAGESI